MSKRIVYFFAEPMEKVCAMGMADDEIVVVARQQRPDGQTTFEVSVYPQDDHRAAHRAAAALLASIADNPGSPPQLRLGAVEALQRFKEALALSPAAAEVALGAITSPAPANEALS